MLSLSKGDLKLAQIRGGAYDKKILKYNDKKESKPIRLSSESLITPQYPNEYVDEDYFISQMDKVDRDEKYENLEKIRRAIRQNSSRGLPKELVNIYNQAISKIVNEAKKNFEIHDNGVLYPLPIVMKDQVDHIYVSGSTGSGKTTWVANYIYYYKKFFPKREIFVFSRLKEDPVLDKHGVTRIEIDDDLLDNKMEPKEFVEESKYGALVIFDDIASIPDKELNKEVHRIRDDLLEVGRHHNISVISTSHMLMNYKQTRNLLNEASAVVFFPKTSSKYHINRYLKVYGGMSNKEIEKIMSLNSRWVYHRKNVPQLIMYEKGCFLL